MISDALFRENRSLAEAIALEYMNIRGVTRDEAFSEARQALLRASRTFDSTKGKFAPYAARAVRNALNSLYAKQLRLARIFPRSLDEPADLNGSGETDSGGATFRGKFADPGEDVIRDVRRRESISILEEVMNVLSPRERIVVEGLRFGKSLSEIGKALDISKQAVHKICTPALEKLRKKLELVGYRGTDSKGLLKSSSKGPRRRSG